MATFKAKFNVGQLVHHRLFDYRGVIIDVDATYQGTEEWYEAIALTRPPKNQPWYHVLVHGAVHRTYVAEKNIEPDPVGEPIDHPEVDYYFDDFKEGRYAKRIAEN